MKILKKDDYECVKKEAAGYNHEQFDTFMEKLSWENLTKYIEVDDNGEEDRTTVDAIVDDICDAWNEAH